MSGHINGMSIYRLPQCLISRHFRWLGIFWRNQILFDAFAWRMKPTCLRKTFEIQFSSSPAQWACGRDRRCTLKRWEFDNKAWLCIDILEAVANMLGKLLNHAAWMVTGLTINDWFLWYGGENIGSRPFQIRRIQNNESAGTYLHPEIWGKHRYYVGPWICLFYQSSWLDVTVGCGSFWYSVFSLSLCGDHSLIDVADWALEI